MWWDKYIKIPFVEKGRDESGSDCWGLVRLIYKNELGIDLPSYDWTYNNTLERKNIAAQIEENKKHSWVISDNPKEFDVILLSVGGSPMHVGVITKKNHMIHCSKDINTCHVPYNNLAWRNKIKGVFRYDTTSSLCLAASV
jgi:probable lipoprotein NlpC